MSMNPAAICICEVGIAPILKREEQMRYLAERLAANHEPRTAQNFCCILPDGQSIVTERATEQPSITTDSTQNADTGMTGNADAEMR